MKPAAADSREGRNGMNARVDEALEVLERTPAILAAWLPGLSDMWVHGTEGPETWSPFNVVGHLIDGEEDDWIVRLRVILEHGEARPFEPYDRFRHLRERLGAPLESLVRQFGDLRAANLAELRSLDLTDAHLGLTGVHPALGRVTVAQLIATWAAHDLSHLCQISRVMAKQYAEAVGPWAEYLSVLHR